MEKFLFALLLSVSNWAAAQTSCGDLLTSRIEVLAKAFIKNQNESGVQGDRVDWFNSELSQISAMDPSSIERFKVRVAELRAFHKNHPKQEKVKPKNLELPIAPQVVKEFKHLKTPRMAHFSSDGKSLLTLEYEGKIQLWDIPTLTVKAQLTVEYAIAAEFREDNGNILITEALGQIQDWDPSKNKFTEILAHLTHSTPTRSVVSPDGKWFALAEVNKGIRLINLSTGRKTLFGYTKTIKDLSFAADSLSLIAGTEDNSVIRFNVPSGTEGTLTSHEKSVVSARLTPDGRLLLSVSLDQTARITDTQTSQVLFEMKSETDKGFSSGRFSSDGKYFLIVDGNTVHIGDTASKKLITEVKADEDLRSAEFSPDGNQVVTTASRTSKIWKLR